MDQKKIKQLLSDVKSGGLSIEAALKRLEVLPFENLDYARLDLHRDLRQGLPEVVFCQNKTPDQVAAIMERLWKHHDRVLGTRATPETAAYVQGQLPKAKYDPTSRLMQLTRGDSPPLSEDSPASNQRWTRVVQRSP